MAEMREGPDKKVKRRGRRTLGGFGEECRDPLSIHGFDQRHLVVHRCLEGGNCCTVHRVKMPEIRWSVPTLVSVRVADKGNC